MQDTSFLKLISKVKKGNVETLAKKFSNIKQCTEENRSILKSALIEIFDGMKNVSDSLHSSTVSMYTPRITEKRKLYAFFKTRGLKLKIYDQPNKQTLFLLSNAA